MIAKSKHFALRVSGMKVPKQAKQNKPSNTVQPCSIRKVALETPIASVSCAAKSGFKKGSGFNVIGSSE